MFLRRSFAVTAMMCCLLVACSRENRSNVICAIPLDPSGSLYVIQHAGMAHAATRLGAKVYWNGPRGGDDTQQQIELMERSIERRDAGIVVTPTAAFALDTVIQRALSEKIPVVVLGSRIPFPSDSHLSFVINDLDKSAEIAAQRICSGRAASEKVAIIGIDPVTPGATALVSAFERDLTLCRHSVRIVSKLGGAATIGQSEATTTKILIEHPELTAIYSLSGAGTMGAVAALHSLHRSEKVRVISIDPNFDLVLLLRRGDIDSLVFPDMRAMGEKAVENIFGTRKHLPLKTVTSFSPVLVTRDNVDSEAVHTLLRMDWRDRP